MFITRARIKFVKWCMVKDHTPVGHSCFPAWECGKGKHTHGSNNPTGSAPMMCVSVRRAIRSVVSRLLPISMIFISFFGLPKGVAVAYRTREASSNRL